MKLFQPNVIRGVPGVSDFSQETEPVFAAYSGEPELGLQPPKPRPFHLLRWRVATVFGAAFLVLALLAGTMAIYPPLLLGTVDFVRDIVGPVPVAYVETWAFEVGTLIRRVRVQMGDTAPRWSLELPAQPLPTALPRPTTISATAALLAPTVRTAPTTTVGPTLAAGLLPATPLPTQAATPPPAQPTPEAVRPTNIRAGWPPPSLPALITDGQLPGEGQWQLLAASGDGGTPIMAVTVLRPDIERPDIQVAIVAIDLERAQLHMVGGTEEPPVMTGTVRLSGIPADVRNSGLLLAGFNGGFKAIHGKDGMAVGDDVYLPAGPRRATVAVTRAGTVQLGLWGREVGPPEDLIAWRQNGHLLVDAGVVTERALQGGLGWGTTVDLQAETWRSGIGLSADSRTLFYAVGDALTAARLAEVMQAAGAWMAFQLDINNYWVRFVTFQNMPEGRLIAQPLISAMPRDLNKYLVSDKRDFFYLTVR